MVLGAVRLVFPEVAQPKGSDLTSQVKSDDLAREVEPLHVDSSPTSHATMPNEPRHDAQRGTPRLPTSHASLKEQTKHGKLPKLTKDSAGRTKWHPVRSVPSYVKCFPDVQDVQIVAAKKWGVRRVKNREEAERRRKELVYVGACPFYCIDKGMTHSIPYLVPRAANLLSDIGRNYLDSLYIKGVPMHRIVVTSVLRTEDDVARLKKSNGNAESQSCHLFGTTFDIAYNRYSTVSPPGEKERRAVRNDTLKWVLSEVLRDVREQGRCYIKYEVKQGCFHITVR